MRRRLLIVALLAACHTEPNAPATPTALQVVAGDGQTGVPGYLLANPIGVRLLDDRGNPVIGDTIEFTLADTSGILGHWVFNSAVPFSVARVVTDSHGVAQTTWRLGRTLGTQQLTARAATVPGIPAAVASATSVSMLAASIGGNAAWLCAIDSQGRLGCWVPPRNDGGVVSTQFAPVAAPVQFAQVVVATYGLALPQGCALATTGHPWCFTLDAQARVTGLTELVGSYPALANITGEGDGLTSASYCGLASDGQAWCWGANAWGQLGDGTLLSHTSPAATATAMRFVQIDVGGEHACAVTSGGDVWCWGANGSSQVGQPSSTLRVTTPVQVTSSVHFTQVLAADIDDAASCGIGNGAGLYCWGLVASLTSQVGVAPSGAPVAIPGVTGLVDLAENSGSVFLLSSTANLLATSSGRAPFVWPGSGVIRDLATPHSFDFLCGTALDGRGTLCQRGFVSDVGPFNLPQVVGVPLP